MSGSLVPVVSTSYLDACPNLYKHHYSPLASSEAGCEHGRSQQSLGMPATFRLENINSQLEQGAKAKG